ncbi:MAG: PTS system mannose/fructose/sorbose family transporter subunit IID [bacterium]
MKPSEDKPSRPPEHLSPDHLPATVLGEIWVRSLAIQAGWNPQRMQNLGLLTTLLPWLRRRTPGLQGRRFFCRRHFELFNTNPYLANFIVGGLLRLEEERRDADRGQSAQIKMVKNSLARSFASLGDQFFWLGLQPALLLLACLLGFWWGIWPGLLVIVVFALSQLELRRRSLAIGYRLGLDIVDVLDHPGWHHCIRQAKRVSLVLVGSFMGCYLARLFNSGPHLPILLVLVSVPLAVGLPALWRLRFAGEGWFMLALPLALVLTYL